MTLLSTSSFKSAYASQIAELKVLVITGLDAPAYNRYDDVRMPGAPVENGKQVDALPVCAHILSMLPNLQKLEIALFPARAKINVSLSSLSLTRGNRAHLAYAAVPRQLSLPQCPRLPRTGAYHSRRLLQHIP